MRHRSATDEYGNHAFALLERRFQLDKEKIVRVA
jgi:hypothetical protein